MLTAFAGTRLSALFSLPAGLVLCHVPFPCYTRSGKWESRRLLQSQDLETWNVLQAANKHRLPFLSSKKSSHFVFFHSPLVSNLGAQTQTPVRSRGQTQEHDPEGNNKIMRLAASTGICHIIGTGHPRMLKAMMKCWRRKVQITPAPSKSASTRSRRVWGWWSRTKCSKSSRKCRGKRKNFRRKEKKWKTHSGERR